MSVDRLVDACGCLQEQPEDAYVASRCRDVQGRLSSSTWQVGLGSVAQQQADHLPIAATACRRQGCVGAFAVDVGVGHEEQACDVVRAQADGKRKRTPRAVSCSRQRRVWVCMSFQQQLQRRLILCRYRALYSCSESWPVRADHVLNCHVLVCVGFRGHIFQVVRLV